MNRSGSISLLVVTIREDVVMYNPLMWPGAIIRWVWTILKTIVYFVFHPKKLYEALKDPVTQGVYHLSSAYTWAGAFFLSLATPTWARDTAAAATTSAAVVWEGLKDSEAVMWATEMFNLVKDVFFDTTSVL